MISDDAETLIRRLLDDGCYFDTEIAKIAGVCSETVRARRHGYRPTRKRGKGTRGKPPKIMPPDIDGELVWCTKCKTKVRLPCLVCQLRAIRRAVRYGDRCNVPVEFDLDDTNRTYPDDPDEYRTDRERYLEVLYARRCAEPTYFPPEEEQENLS